MRLRIVGLLGFWLLAGLTSLAQAQVPSDYYVKTGITGAQTQIDTNHTSSFTIFSQSSLSFAGGLFTMKAGSATSAPITFKLYDSAAKTTLLTETTYTNTAAFCSAHGGNCQSFIETPFTFSSPVSLLAGKAYFAELTSVAPDVQSRAYFIKGAQSCYIATAKGTTVPSSQCSFAVEDTSGSAPPPPELRIAKQGPETVTADKAFTYTLTVLNDGTGPASGATIKDQLPAGLTYGSLSGADWSCSAAGNPALLTCQYAAAIASGAQSSPLLISVTPDGSEPSMVNWASVDPTGGNLPSDPSDANCSEAETQDGICATVVTALKPKDEPYLSVDIDDPEPDPEPGEETVYTITVENDGDDDAPGDSHVYVDIPDGTDFDETKTNDESPAWSCQEDGSIVDCERSGDPIPPTDPDDPSGEDQIHIVIDIPEDIPEGTTLDIEVYVDRSGDEIPEIPDNCSATATIDCKENDWTIGVDGYEIAKSQPVPPLRVGEHSIYTIAITTTGENVSTDVKDQLPEGMTLVGVTGEGWTCSASAKGLITCNKKISSGKPEKIQVEVAVEASINADTLTNYASVGAEGAAPKPGPECNSVESCAASRATVEDVREKISEVVENDVEAYLETRLDRIVSALDQDSRLRRFRDTECGLSKSASMSGEATSQQANLGGSASASLKGFIVPTADAVTPQTCGSLNIWSSLDISHVSGDDSAWSSTGLATIGAEYLITETLLAGVRLSLDYTDTSLGNVSEANSSFDGFGWFAGPYISAEILRNVFLDGFVGYGTSWNSYSGHYAKLDLDGNFDTQRVLGYLNVSGEYEAGAVSFSPLLGVSYASEWSDSFDVHNEQVGSAHVSGQDAQLGRLTSQLEVTYGLIKEADSLLEVFLVPQVTYDFARDGGDEVDALLGGSDWRGGINGGFRYDEGRFGANLTVGYDGIGVSDWSAYSGELQLSYVW